MVERMNREHSIEIQLACEACSVSRGGYYDWLKRPVSERALENDRLIARIRSIHEESDNTYGSPRVTAKLRSEGLEIGEVRIARLMRKEEIVSESVKKFKITTTDSNHDLPIADRIFETEHAKCVMAPNQVWTGDLTYVWTEEGWLFLAVFLDIFSRKIVGHAADDNMRAELVLEALAMALGRQDVKRDELIAHTDRGSQYAGEKFRSKLNLVGIIASMSRRGNCYDNAHVESFFHSLKTELVYRRKFKTREEAKRAIFEWIETWYNRQRLHSSLDYNTPEQYEKSALAS